MLKILLLITLFSTIYAGDLANYKFSRLADGWLKLHTLPATWNEARLRCKAEGAVLVSPTTTTLRQAIIDHVTRERDTNYNIFTGIHGTFSIEYTSIEGLSFSNMDIDADASRQLNNLMNSESCIIMTMNNGTIFEGKCTDELPYVCYMKTAINKCGTHDAEYKLYPETGSCYKFHRQGQTWGGAFMTCATEGGHLAIINSEHEHLILKALFAENPDNLISADWPFVAAIGFHDLAKRDGTWLTILGETLYQAGFDRFDAGEPNRKSCGDEVELCGSILRSGNLNDQCCNEVVPFICEKKPSSL